MKEISKCSHLCVNCGKSSYLDVATKDSAFPDGGGVLVNARFPRECRHCKKLKTYPIVLGNYKTNLFSMLQRVKLLEDKIKELEKQHDQST